MKKFAILFFVFLLAGMIAQSQRIYIRGGLGAAVSTSASYVNEYSYGDPYGSISTVTSKKRGIGTGLPFMMAAGYNLTDNFSLELGIDYFYGFSIKNSAVYLPYVSEVKYYGQMLSIVPAFVMSLPLGKFKPYARLGLKLGILNRVISEGHRVTGSPEKSAYMFEVNDKAREYGGIAIGVQAAMGTEFLLSKLISLFCEIQVDGISYAPKHGKYVEYLENGVDVLDERTVKKNKWNYLKEVDHTKTIPDDQPNEYNKVNEHFSNVGLVIGVKITL
jgi:hypothetical protein